MWAVAVRWAFTGHHSFLRASSHLQDTHYSWPRTREAYTWHCVHRAERQGPRGEWGEGHSREPVPAPDVTQTPRDPLLLFSLDLPLPSVPVLAVGEGKTERVAGKGVETSRCGPQCPGKSPAGGKSASGSGTIHQSAGNICHE